MFGKREKRFAFNGEMVYWDDGLISSDVWLQHCSTRDKFEVAVIMPVGYLTPHLRASIDSAKSQMGPFSIHLIVILDGLDERDSEKILGILEEQQNFRISILRSKINRGAGSSRNMGLEMVKYEKYVSFLDADCMWSPTHILFSTRILERRSEYAAAYSGQIVCDDHFEVIGERFVSNSSKGKNKVNHVDLNTLTVRWSAVKHLRFPQTRRLVDWDYIRDIENFGKIIGYPEFTSIYVHSDHPKRISNAEPILRTSN